MKRREAQIFDLSERFIKGAHVVIVKLNEKTVLRSLVFDSATQKKYEAIVEAEMWAYFDSIKAEMARVLAE